MFNKVTDKNTIDYYIQSQQDDIHIHVVYDENYFIALTYVSIIDGITRTKLTSYVGLIDPIEYKGVFGFHLAISHAVAYMSKNSEMGFTDFDIISLVKASTDDFINLRELCHDTVGKKGFFGNNKMERLYKEEYLNE